MMREEAIMEENKEIKQQEKHEDLTGITCIYVPVRDVYESILDGNIW